MSWLTCTGYNSTRISRLWCCGFIGSEIYNESKRRAEEKRKAAARTAQVEERKAEEEERRAEEEAAAKKAEEDAKKMALEAAENQPIIYRQIKSDCLQ